MGRVVESAYASERVLVGGRVVGVVVARSIRAVRLGRVLVVANRRGHFDERRVRNRVRHFFFRRQC